MKSTYYSHSDKALIRKWGEKIRSLRISAGYTQTELAQKTGMSRSSIAEIEKGRNFSVASLISMSRSLSILDELQFFFKEESHKLTPMEIYEKDKNKPKRGGYNK
jgi:transcriptional regulator with XRE-family HTH domain